MEAGKTYYYKVQLLNRAGTSVASSVVSATIPTPTEELPLTWNFSAIGNTLGGAKYAEAQDTSFIAAIHNAVFINGKKTVVW